MTRASVRPLAILSSNTARCPGFNAASTLAVEPTFALSLVLLVSPSASVQEHPPPAARGPAANLIGDGLCHRARHLPVHRAADRVGHGARDLRPMRQGGGWSAVAAAGTRQLARQAVVGRQVYPVRPPVALVMHHELQQVLTALLHVMPRVRVRRRRGLAADRDAGRSVQGQSYLQTQAGRTSFRPSGYIRSGLERAGSALGPGRLRSAGHYQRGRVGAGPRPAGPHRLHLIGERVGVGGGGEAVAVVAAAGGHRVPGQGPGAAVDLLPEQVVGDGPAGGGRIPVHGHAPVAVVAGHVGRHPRCRGRRGGGADRRRAQARPHRGLRLQAVLVGRTGRDRRVLIGQGRRRQVISLHTEGRFPALPPHPVARHRPARGGGGPAQGHGGGGGTGRQVGRRPRYLGQVTGGPLGADRAGRQPVGTAGGVAEAQPAPPAAAAGPLAHQVQAHGSSMGTPGMGHRRRGRRPLVRRQRIGGRGQQRQLRARGAGGGRGRGAPAHAAVGAHPVVVDRAGRKAAVRPGGGGRTRVGDHGGPHARLRVRGAGHLVARERLRARVGGCGPAQAHLALRRGGGRQVCDLPGHARRLRRGDAHGRRAQPVPGRRHRLQPVLVGRAGTHRIVRMAQGVRRQGVRLYAEGRFSRLPPQPVARHRTPRGGGSPGQRHRRVAGLQGQVPGHPRGRGQIRGGARHRRRTGGQPVGAGGALAVAHHAPPARGLAAHIQRHRGGMRGPGVGHRRRGQRPGVRGERIGGRGVESQAGSGAARGRSGVAQPLGVAARHPVVNHRVRAQPGVRPGGGGGARVRHLLDPHARLHVRRPLDAVAANPAGRGQGRLPGQLQLTVVPRCRRQFLHRRGSGRPRGEGGTDPGRLPRRVARPHLHLVGRLVGQIPQGVRVGRDRGVGLRPGRRGRRLGLQMVCIRPPARLRGRPVHHSHIGGHLHRQGGGIARRHLHRGARAGRHRRRPCLVEGGHAQLIGGAREQVTQRVGGACHLDCLVRVGRAGFPPFHVVARGQTARAGARPGDEQGGGRGRRVERGDRSRPRRRRHHRQGHGRCGHPGPHV